MFRHLVKNHPEIDLLSSSNYVVDIGPPYCFHCLPDCLHELMLFYFLGAYDGMIQSNSYNFFFDLGWSALLVEPSTCLSLYLFVVQALS